MAHFIVFCSKSWLKMFLVIESLVSILLNQRVIVQSVAHIQASRSEEDMNLYSYWNLQGFSIQEFSMQFFKKFVQKLKNK